ncbi:hypothetical protein Q9K02_02995 [Qipengyuania sp. G39]|uniref:Uncharacterized protein n=1 Tax=Qipengyuania profundimaris TaxID=3067652 RepID=A0ABT9HLT6_9SPHN|nr:hypothetical protein [Qipengyuania sp. G39]MDP4574106.1 hypothetical protein [Qipengyuania sp. G39]
MSSTSEAMVEKHGTNIRIDFDDFVPLTIEAVPEGTDEVEWQSLKSEVAHCAEASNFVGLLQHEVTPIASYLEALMNRPDRR